MTKNNMKEQIRYMVLDLVDNMDAPATFPNHTDFKREWLNVLVDVAQEEIRKL